MRRRWIGLLLFAVSGCGTEQTGVTDGGRPDVVAAVPENTAARCQDGIDNDNDGKIDCQDPDCWVLSFCLDAGIADATLDAPAPDAPPELGPLDAASDGPQTSDGQTGGDGPSTDATPGSCNTHCDCPQGEFCYYGTCLSDPKMPVYCCAKTGCPPGRWCFETGGAKGTCAESTTHPCQDACDCGPAHCCKKASGASVGHCVKDTADPWDPGGVVVGSLGECAQGTDATYCCTDPMCHAGRYAYGGAGALFKCFDRTKGPSGILESFCSGKSCFGTACNCDPGESCLDASAKTQVVGKTCYPLSGGSCVSNAVAEAVYGWSPSDLLPCCAKGCLSGQQCEVGWRSDGEYAYARVVGVCGGSCGNGSCDPGESASTCPGDCTFPLIGTSKCSAMSGTWSAPTLCGDGVCQGSGICDWTEAESCKTCPQDCGVCGWAMVHGSGLCRALTADLWSVWGSSPSDIFAVGGTCSGGPFVCADGVILHFDGKTWRPMVSGTNTGLDDVWGSSATDVFAVGWNGTIVHYDGYSWTPMASGTGLELRAVWGTSASSVFAVGGTYFSGGSCTGCAGGVILQYDGTGWKTTHTHALPLHGVWGTSATDVFAVGSSGTVLHYDGNSWQPMASGVTNMLLDVWASSPTDVFAVGMGGAIVHYNGNSWQPMASSSTTMLRGVWGSSPTDVYAVGWINALLHYDGSSWNEVLSTIDDNAFLNAIWGMSSSEVYAVGDIGDILRYDGTAWKAIQSGADSRLTDVWGSSTSDVFAVGEPIWDPVTGTGKDHVMHFDGTAWTAFPTGMDNSLFGVWGSSPTDVYALGFQQLLHYDGSAWKTVNTGFSERWDGVWGSSASDVFIVGTDGAILHHDGSTWTKMPSGTTENLGGVWGASPISVFAVGGGGTILHYNGSSWSGMSSGSTEYLSSVWGSSASDVFVVGTEGTIVHYNGSSWQAMASGTTQDLHGVWGKSPTDVYAVGGTRTSPAEAKSTFLHYDGSSWQPVRVDLRESGTRLCRTLGGINGTVSGGGVFVVGENRAILQRVSAP